MYSIRKKVNMRRIGYSVLVGLVEKKGEGREKNLIGT